MNVFVTGATGVLGKRAVPMLVAAGHRVTGVGRSPEKRSELAGQGATPIELDLFSRDAVRRAVAGHEAIVNLVTHMPGSSLRMLLPGAWRENDRIRREFSAILADAAARAGATRFIQESFAPIYEDQGDRWIDESDPVRPARYNRTVLDAERAAEGFTAASRNGIALRFAMFYGPDAAQSLDMIRLARKGIALVPGKPDAFLSSVSHDDAAAAAVAALALPAGVYNVADDEPLRRSEFLAAIGAAAGAATPKPLPAWIGRLMGSLGELLARSLRISNRKLRDASSWRPRHPSAREGWRSIAQKVRPAA